MVSAFNLAGLFTAHSLWCVSDGDQCFPLLAYVDAAGERNMERFGGDAPRSYPQARERLDQNVMGAVDAAFVFPGKIDEQAAQRDAIISEVRSYAHPQARAVVAVPFLPPAAGGLRVFKPKLLMWEGCQAFNAHAAMDSFFDGVDQHEQGAAIWQRAIAT